MTPADSPYPDTRPRWEAEIKIRRNGRLYRRESALGGSPLMAFDNATNDLVRELQIDG